MLSRLIMIAGRHVLLVLFALAGAFACSSNEASSTSTDTGSEAATSCERTAGSCGAGCCPQHGNRYDEARDCLDSRGDIVIGCTPKPASTTCGYLGVTGCAITTEGTTRSVWYTANQAAGWDAPERCSDALAAKVRLARPCVSADAGSETGM